jgi:cob(I)alamin adenosyltransferase
MNKGLLSVFTGDGKGKTTAALGLAFRALGHGKKVCFIQFIKGAWVSGEAKFSKNLHEFLDFHVMGRGFTWKSEDIEKDREAAREAWNFAVRMIRENSYDLIVLDELTYLIQYNMMTEEEILRVLKNKPKRLHLVVTGRNASSGLLELADLITEMKAVKHPYASGVKAQKGFDY